MNHVDVLSEIRVLLHCCVHSRIQQHPCCHLTHGSAVIMQSVPSQPTERTRLLSIRSLHDATRLGTPSNHDPEAASFADSFVSKEEELLGNTAVGEILPYNDYSSIDF